MFLDKRVKYKHKGKTTSAPLGEALAALDADDKAGAIRKLMDGFSKVDRFRVFVELAAAPAKRGPGPGIVYEGSIAFTKLGRKSGPLARDAADALVARHGARVPNGQRWPVFAALLAAKIPIEPRWDVLLPVAFHDRDDAQCEKLVPWMLDALRAIPEPRRDAAIVGALENEKLSVIRNGRRVLTVWPSAKVVATMLKHASTPRKLAASLREERPALARVLDALLEGRKPPVVLRRGAVREITSPKGLTPLEREQIAIAGRRWDGQRLDVGARLGKSADAEAALVSLERTELCAESGKVVYEAYTHSGDSGTVFAAGTKRAVASIVQTCVECSNDALREAIEVALES